jgi:hypothetical protein
MKCAASIIDPLLLPIIAIVVSVVLTALFYGLLSYSQRGKRKP